MPGVASRAAGTKYPLMTTVTPAGPPPLPIGVEQPAPQRVSATRAGLCSNDLPGCTEWW